MSSSGRSLSRSRGFDVVERFLRIRDDELAYNCINYFAPRFGLGSPMPIQVSHRDLIQPIVVRASFRAAEEEPGPEN